MSNKSKVIDLTAKEPLIDRQRILWSHAETIELAQMQGKPIPIDISEWLHRALKKIACGEDANAIFNVVPEKRGVRKNSFLREKQQKMTNGHIAANIEATEDGAKGKKTSQAIEEISQAFPATEKSTVRKNWNRISTDREPTFTIGKK